MRSGWGAQNAVAVFFFAKDMSDLLYKGVFFPIINGHLCSFFRAGDDVRVPDSVQKDWRAKGGNVTRSIKYFAADCWGCVCFIAK